MAVQQFKVSTVEMESFTDESIKVCLIQVQNLRNLKTLR